MLPLEAGAFKPQRTTYICLISPCTLNIHLATIGCPLVGVKIAAKNLSGEAQAMQPSRHFLPYILLFCSFVVCVCCMFFVHMDIRNQS